MSVGGSGPPLQHALVLRGTEHRRQIDDRLKQLRRCAVIVFQTCAQLDVTDLRNTALKGMSTMTVK